MSTEKQPVKTKSNLVEVVNVSSYPQTFDIAGSIHELKPGETAKVHEAYGLPRKTSATAHTVDSVVEHLTGGNVVPIDHKKARGFRMAREAESKSR